jgi:hypothetical protein
MVCASRIGPFKISNSTYILCTTALDILGLIAILLGIEFAGSGLFTGVGWLGADYVKMLS